MNSEDFPDGSRFQNLADGQRKLGVSLPVKSINGLPCMHIRKLDKSR